jgi:hypothetical protein
MNHTKYFSRTAAFAGLISALLVSGCKTNPDAGDGPLSMTYKTKAAFDNYLKLQNPFWFAVSIDGQSSGWSYCTSGSNCTGTSYDAISYCESSSKGTPCKLYAQGRNVIWEGPITLRPDAAKIEGSSTQGKESTKDNPHDTKITSQGSGKKIECIFPEIGRSFVYDRAGRDFVYKVKEVDKEYAKVVVVAGYKSDFITRLSTGYGFSLMLGESATAIFDKEMFKSYCPLVVGRVIESTGFRSDQAGSWKRTFTIGEVESMNVQGAGPVDVVKIIVRTQGLGGNTYEAFDYIWYSQKLATIVKYEFEQISGTAEKRPTMFLKEF